MCEDTKKKCVIIENVERNNSYDKVMMKKKECRQSRLRVTTGISMRDTAMIQKGIIRITSHEMRKRNGLNPSPKTAKKTSQENCPTTGPNVSPGARTYSGVPSASAVFCQTVFPHQLSVKPPLGNWTQKKITTMPSPTPASRPADKM